MDPLTVFESACKSIRLVKRGVGAYLGEVRRVWVGALDDVAEQARQHLLAVEEEEEVSAGTSDRENFEAEVRARYGWDCDTQGAPLFPKCVCGHLEVEHRTVISGLACYLVSCDCKCYTPIAASPSGAPTAGDDPVGVEQKPPAPPTGERSDPANPGEFAAVAVREVLAEHTGYVMNGGVDCALSDGFHHRFADWFDWREHIGTEVSRRINAAAADRRVADRLDAARFAQNTFEQHRNK